MGGRQVTPSLIHQCQADSVRLSGHQLWSALLSCCRKTGLHGLVKLSTILHKGAKTKAPRTKPHHVRAKVLGMDLQPSKLGLGLGMNAGVKDT